MFPHCSRICLDPLGMRLITSYVHFAMINQSSSHPVRGGQKIEDKQSNQTESCAGYWGGSHSCSSRLTAGGGCPFDKLPAEFLEFCAAYLMFFTFLHGVKAFERSGPAFLPRGAPTSGIQTLWLEQPLFLYSWKWR